MSLARVCAPAAFVLMAFTAAAPAFANPISECEAASADTIAARACLRDRLAAAERGLRDMRAAILAAAQTADLAQGRDVAARRAEAAAASFDLFRGDACRLEAAVAAAHEDVGAWEVACAIARTEARIRELERLLEHDPPGPVAVARPAVEPARPSAPDLLAAPSAAAFRDWRMACGEGACHIGAVGEGPDGEYAFILSRVEDAADWTFSTFAPMAEDGVDAVTGQIDGRATPALDVSPLSGGGLALSPQGDGAAAFLAQLRRGATLTLTFPAEGASEASVRFSLMGMTAALNAANDQAAAGR